MTRCMHREYHDFSPSRDLYKGETYGQYQYVLSVNTKEFTNILSDSCNILSNQHATEK